MTNTQACQHSFGSLGYNAKMQKCCYRIVRYYEQNNYNTGISKEKRFYLEFNKRQRHYKVYFYAVFEQSYSNISRGRNKAKTIAKVYSGTDYKTYSTYY